MKNLFLKKKKSPKKTSRFWRISTWTMILSTLIGLLGLAERILALTEAKNQVEQKGFIAKLKEERSHEI